MPPITILIGDLQGGLEVIYPSFLGRNLHLQPSDAGSRRRQVHDHGLRGLQISTGFA
jgi:hypothetical protein